MDKFGKLFDRAIRPNAAFRRAAIKECMIESCLKGVNRNTPILKAAASVRSLPWAAWAQALYEQVDNHAFINKVQRIQLSRHLIETCDGPGMDYEKEEKKDGFKELNKKAEKLAKKTKKDDKKKKKESVGEKEETYYLTKDGKELFRGSQNQCLEYLHDTTSASWDHNFKHEGYKITSASADESVNEGNLEDHARRELQIAGLFDKDSDYDGMLGEAVMELMELFGEQGHSGFSAGCTIDLFKRLASFENLTELTDNPDEWMQVNEHDDDKPNSRPSCWQSCRRSDAFSEDGGKTYYTLADKALHYEDDDGSWFYKPDNWKEKVEWISSKHVELADSKKD